MLRARLFGQGLWSDELITLRELEGRGVGDLLRELAYGIENSPPLYFLLAWLSSKLGSDPALLRLPSLAFGSATVPLVYLLGVRSVGRRAGVVAAGFLALSPFAIYYSVDARPYAMLLFFSALSGLALLVALERGGTLRWAAWSLSVAAVLYTHYTGAAVLAAEAGWVLLAHPARRRELAAAAAIAAALFIPWTPFVRGEGLVVYDQIAAFLGIGPLDSALSWLAGLPLLTSGRVPGTLPLALLGIAVAIALVAAPLPHPSPRSPAAMLAVLALATPVAVGLYSLLSNDLFLFPRSLTASLPFVALLLGSALVRPRAPVAAVAVALAAAGIGAGAFQTGQDRNSRPDFPVAAALIDELAGPAEPVAYARPGIDAARLRASLELYYDRPHPALLSDDPQVWTARRRSRLVVVMSSPVGRPAPRLPELPGMVRREERDLPGLSSLAVGFYRAR